MSASPSARRPKDGLIQPYKVSTWDAIPADAKDADGYWYGDYYGVMAFLVNTDIVSKAPSDWADLMDPPTPSRRPDRRSARIHTAIQGVYAAGLA